MDVADGRARPSAGEAMTETSKTVSVRLPEDVVEEARTWGRVFSGKATPGGTLAEAWYEYLRDHEEELDHLEDEAREKRKELAKRARHPAARKPKPDGGKTYA